MKDAVRFFSLLVMTCLLAAFAGCASTDERSGTGEYIDDTVITTKVKTAILGDSNLRTSEINVETYKNVVQLSGFVGSQEEIDRAMQLARDVGGVDSVVNSMQVRTASD